MEKASKSQTSMILRMNMKVEVTKNWQIAWYSYYVGKIVSKLVKKQWHITWRRMVQEDEMGKALHSSEYQLKMLKRAVGLMCLNFDSDIILENNIHPAITGM